jgi:hypothetical protein
LNQICWLKTRLKEQMIKVKKNIENEWWVQSYHKRFTLVLELYKLYLSDPFIFFAIQFWYKKFIFYLLIPSLRYERERERPLHSSSRKRKSISTPILPTKKVDFGVNVFYFIREVLLRFFSPWNSLKNIFNPRRFFLWFFVVFF